MISLSKAPISNFGPTVAPGGWECDSCCARTVGMVHVAITRDIPTDSPRIGFQLCPGCADTLQLRLRDRTVER